MKRRDLAVGLLASVSCAIVAAPSRAATQNEIAFHIGEQPVQTALSAFARQSGMHILFPYDQVNGIRSQAVTGRMAPRVALELLLHGTPLHVAMVHGNTVALSVANPVLLTRAAGGPSLQFASAFQAQPAAPQQGLPAAAAGKGQVTTADVADDISQPDIVVVGSQIRGSKATEALPVTVISRAQIAATGAVSGDELFRSIPQMGGVTFNSAYIPNSSNSARGDVGSVNLRELGPGNTLVLLNGRRVVNHPVSQADENLVPVISYNTNAIPVSGVERLEVLRDGAAAIYGTDAVAGVVNTVLRDNFHGVSLNTQYGFAQGTNLRESATSGTIGHNFDRGNVTLFASYTHRDPLNARDEPYTASADKRGLFTGTRFAGATSLDGRLSTSDFASLSTPATSGTLRSGTTALTSSAGLFHIQPQGAAGCGYNFSNGTCLASGALASTGANRDLRYDAPAANNTTVMPEVDRINLFLTGHYQVTDGLEVFGEAGYYHAVTHSYQAPAYTLSSVLITVPSSNYYNPFGPVIFANGAANPNRIAGLTNVPAAGLPVTIRSYLFSDAGPSEVTDTNYQYRLLGGVRFNAFGLKWESAALYSRAGVLDQSDGVSATLLQRQLALSTPDAYNPFSGGNVATGSLADTTPSSAAALNAIKVRVSRRDTSSLALADLKGSTANLFDLPGGPIGLAVGGEVRRETQHDDRDPRVDGSIGFTDSVSGIRYASDLVGTSQTPDTEGHRIVASAYAELAIPVISPEMGIPLVRHIELQVAGRFEHYSDIGSVAKPKIAGAWDVLDGLRLRGSWSQGFKAPNLEQINATVVSRSNTRVDYVRCEADLRAGRITSFANCGENFSTLAQRSGNPNLKPETSDEWSVGVVLEPHFLPTRFGRLTGTVDLWHIRQKGIVGVFGEGNALILDYLDRINGTTNPNVVRAAATADEVAAFAGTGLTPVGQVLYVKDQYMNLLPQTSSGIDFGLNWTLNDTSIGNFSLDLNAALLRKFYRDPSAEIAELLTARAAGVINAGTIITGGGDLIRQGGRPRWRGSAALTWSYKQLQIGAYSQYTGSVDDTDLADSSGYYLESSQITGNLYVQFTIPDPRKMEYRLRLGVRNIADTAPPLSAAGYNGQLYNPYGRYLYANAGVTF